MNLVHILRTIFYGVTVPSNRAKFFYCENIAFTVHGTGNIATALHLFYIFCLFVLVSFNVSIDVVRSLLYKKM